MKFRSGEESMPSEPGGASGLFGQGARKPKPLLRENQRMPE